MRTKTQQPSSQIFADGITARRELALHPDAIGLAYEARPASDLMQVVGGVAVLEIEGPLTHKGGGGWWCFWESYERIAVKFCSALADTEVQSVLIKFDSPGGEVSGLTETVRLMQAAKEESGKRVIAYVDEDCYSAAYALAMVADEIYLPDAGGVGSIGVITAMVDVTAHDAKEGLRVEVIASGSKKADGHPHVPLSDGAIKRTRKRVDKLANAFFELVSDSRGIPVDAIADMQAGVFSGSDAVAAGLADGVMSLSECLTLAGNVFGSTDKPTERSEGKEMTSMGILAAAKALADANAKLAAAKTDGARAKAAAEVTAAEAKYKHEKKTVTEKEEGDGKQEDASDDDSSKSGTDSEDSESGSGSTDSSSSESDSDEGSTSSTDSSSTGAEEAGDSARTGLHTKDRLLRLARQITGEQSIARVMGALNAMHESHKQTKQLAAKVEKLEQSDRSAKLSAIIEKGVRAGKITPGMKSWARTQSPTQLKAFLEHAPKVAPIRGEDERAEKRTNGAELGAVTPEMARIWKKLGFAEKDFPGLLAKMNNAQKSVNGAN